MTRHVVIIGAGVIGLCAAYYCRQRGWRVTVLERHAAVRDGCSFGNAGLIVPSHFVPLAAPGMIARGVRWLGDPASPFYIRPRLDWDLLSWGYRFWRACSASRVARAAPVLRDLNLASRTCYHELARDLDDFGLAGDGLLLLCKSQHALDEEVRTAEIAGQLGLAHEVLNRSATAAFDPGIQMDVSGSVYYPQDCHLNPARFMSAIQSRVIRDGCDVRFGTAVIGFRTTSSRVSAVRTNGVDLEADEVVLASGCWSGELVRQLGVKLLLQAGKGYSLTLDKPRQLPRACAILTEARVAVTPLGPALRFGGTMELAGQHDAINPARVQGIVNAVPRYYPAFQPDDFAAVKPWCGLRPCSPDGLPYLGRTRKWSNLIVAAGHAMMGVSLGPVSGRLVAQLAAHERPEIDLSLLSPDR
jgi:D-amino-acid dehydrogenase